MVHLRHKRQALAQFVKAPMLLGSKANFNRGVNICLSFFSAVFGLNGVIDPTERETPSRFRKVKS